MTALLHPAVRAKIAAAVKASITGRNEFHQPLESKPSLAELMAVRTDFNTWSDTQLVDYALRLELPVDGVSLTEEMQKLTDQTPQHDVDPSGTRSGPG